MVPTLETIATRCLSTLIASGREDVLLDVVKSAPLSLVLPCLRGVRSPHALAALEDAFGDEGKMMLDRNWRALFRLRNFSVVGRSVSDPDKEKGKQRAAVASSTPSSSQTSAPPSQADGHWKEERDETAERGEQRIDGSWTTRSHKRGLGGERAGDEDDGGGATAFGDWRARYEAAAAAEEAKLASLRAKLRDLQKEEEELKASKKIAVLEAPPRPLAGAFSKGPRTKHHHSTGVRDRLIKKLSSSFSSSSPSSAKNARALAAAAEAAATTGRTTTRTSTPATAASIPPHRLARPLVVPGNEPRRRRVPTATGSPSGAAREQRERRRRRVLEEAPLFGDE